MNVMNAKQRRVLIVVAICVVGMMLYPPFYFPAQPEMSNGPAVPLTHDYHWLFGWDGGRVDVPLLLVQFLALGVVGAIAFVLCADKK